MPLQNGRSSGGPPTSVSKFAAAAQSEPLTPRQLEVVEWIAAGKRNAEIGEILGCSPQTVKKHIEHILFKLRLENRTGVCTWWHEQGKTGAGFATQSPAKS